MQKLWQLCVLIVGLLKMSKSYLSYRELIRLKTFEERFEYLKQGAVIGEATFGSSRYLNQIFYRSSEWRQVRNQIIIRDNGCDLGMEDRQISGSIVLHHINPITEDDIIGRAELLLDPENLICVSHNTHNALHYGDISLTDPTDVVVRRPGDTKLW